MSLRIEVGGPRDRQGFLIAEQHPRWADYQAWLATKAEDRRSRRVGFIEWLTELEHPLYSEYQAYARAQYPYNALVFNYWLDQKSKEINLGQS